MFWNVTGCVVLYPHIDGIRLGGELAPPQGFTSKCSFYLKLKHT
jgi:hypothetical protein